MQSLKEVDWTTFKSMVTDQTLGVKWVPHNAGVILYGYDDPFCVHCTLINPSDDYTDFDTNFKDLWRGPLIRQSQTQREVKYLRLQGVTLSADADANTGVCVATVEVPATGADSGRYLDWGEGWITGDSHPDDKITAIDVEAPDGQGGWVKLAGYCDDDSPAAGWAIPMKPEIAEVEPLGWYGFIPGGNGVRLRIAAQCGGSAPFTGRKLKANLGWGKRDV